MPPASDASGGMIVSMDRESKTDIAVMIYAVLLLILEFVVIWYENRPQEWYLQKIYTGISARDLWVELPDIERPKPPKIIIEREGGTFKPYFLTYKRMKLTSLGKYYITAYCPSECGYNGSNYPTGWTSASGTICHRADYNHRLSEPTTVAIDMAYNRFGQTFYIEEFDRTFIAEDNGAFRGKWLDLFYTEYSDVCSFPTGNYTVYLVEWEEVTVLVDEIDNEFLQIMPPTEYYRAKGD